jgi:hypothetical protein
MSLTRDIERAWAAHDPSRRNPPIGAEARGRVRMFKNSLAAPAAQIDAAACSEAVYQAAADFVFKKNKGRARALDRLHRLLRPAVPQVAIEDDPPMAAWAWLAPSGSLFFSTDIEKDLGLGQDAVLMRYLIAGRSGTNSATSGAWTIEVPDHALGRLLQRCRGADPAAAIWQAHAALMEASTAEVADCVRQERSFYLLAGNGVFACKPMIVRSANVAQALLYARARTWLSSNQLRPDQRPITPTTSGDAMALTMFARLERDEPAR